MELYNVETRKPEALPEEKIQTALQLGTHSYPQGTRLNVVGPDGQTQSVASSDAVSAFDQGYRLESSREAAIRQYVEENKGLRGATKVALGKAASEVALGLPELIYEKTGDDLEVAKWEALKKDHGTASLAGGATGFVGSLFVGAPLFKGAAKVGEKAAQAVAGQLAAAGIKTGTESMARTIVAKMGANAARLGAEGVVVSAPRAVTEAMLGDPEQAAETLMVGGALGAGLGLGASAFGGGIKTLAEKYSKSLDKASKAVPGVEQGLESQAPKAQSEFGIYKDLLGKKKANAPQIIRAAEEEGVRIMPGQTEAMPVFGQMGDALSNRPTLPAIKYQNDVVKPFYEDMNRVASKLTGVEAQAAEQAGLSRRMVGDEIKEGLLNRFGAGKEEASKLFDEIAPMYKTIELQDRSLSNAISKIRSEVGDLAPEAESYLSYLEKSAAKTKTLDQLKQLKTNLREALPKAPTQQTKRVSAILGESLNDLETGTLKDFAGAMKSPEMKEKILGLIEQRNSANSAWKQLISDAGDLGLKKKVGSPGAFIDYLETVDPEDLVNKLWQAKKSTSLETFAQTFPEEFQKLRQFKLSELAEKSIKDGQYQFGALTRELKKLSPEARQMLLGDAGEKSFQNFKTILESVPTPANPSGTSYATALGKLFTPEGVMMNLSDAAQYALLKGKTIADKSIDGLLHVEQSMKNAAYKLDSIRPILEGFQSVKGNIRPEALGLLTRLAEESDQKKAFKRIQEEINRTTTDPIHMSTKNGVYVDALRNQGAPTIADAFNQKMIAAMTHLNDKMPRPLTPPNPLNPKQQWSPSDQEIGQFERRMAVAMDPFSVLDSLKNGTVSKEEIDTLSTLYPKIYDRIKSKIISEVSTLEKPLPYQARLRMSLLLGHNFDPSVQPQAVVGFQKNFQLPQGPQPQNVNLTLATRTAPNAGAR